MKMKNIFDFLKKSKIRLTQPVGSDSENAFCEDGGIGNSLDENISHLKELFGKSFDLIIKQSEVSGIKIAFVLLDGMYDNLLVSQAVVEPIIKSDEVFSNADELFVLSEKYCVSECDAKELSTQSDAVDLLLSGCMLFFVDGIAKCRSFSVQGYPKKSIDSPESEAQENGSHEGFADMYKDNVTLVRRRLKNPYVRFETVSVGETSNTVVCVCYHAKRANPDTVNDVINRIKNAKLDIVCGSGALRPFLENGTFSVFSTVGSTERPDVFAAKLAEGRIGIIVDGTPYALIVPHLFIENFHSLDDYLNRPYYAAVARLMKIVCFLLAVFLPGAYVAVGTFHQEIFPSAVIYDIVTSLENTPLPLLFESLVIHFIYEIVREAGLRMPKTVGHTVSIVGALVIGDAAVTAGLISAPMLIIVAITAICSAVISQLHQPSSVLRIIFIIVGGTMGLFGIMLCFALLTIGLCSQSSFGVPFTSPVSPFDPYAARDSVVFAGWKTVGKRFMKIENLKGSTVNGREN